jgi:transposase InsO family protein
VSHANARLTPRGRLILVERIAGGWPVSRAARAAGISRQTGSKWWNRYRREGVAGLVDRRSRVHRQARALDGAVIDELCRLRRQLRVGPHRLAWQTGISRSTIYAVLRRRRLSRLDRLEPRPSVVRYERTAPGELVHLDTKSLGRIRPGGGLPKPQRAAGYGSGRKRPVGWTRVHVAVDDHSRLAYVEELADEAPATTAAFLERAVAFYAGHGITVRRVLSDNGGCYRSRAFATAAEQLGIGLRKTRPYRPQTNGKAERFIRTLLSEWAYAQPFHDTAARAAALPAFVDFYNRSRPHWSLNGQPPVSRVPPVNNLMGKNS